MRLWSAVPVMLLVVANASADPRTRARAPRLGTVPPPDFTWEISLEPLLQLPVQHGVRRRVYFVDPGNTSDDATIALRVANHSVGYFTADCAPQLVVLVHEYFPPAKPDVRCHALVLSPAIAGDHIAWNRAEGVFIGRPQVSMRGPDT